MRIEKIIILLILTFVALTSTGQNKTGLESYSVIMTTEKGKTAAQFPGGKDSLNTFTFRNLKLERQATCSHPNNIRIQFTVEETGEITDINYLKPSDSKACQETIRFIKSMPKWVPATKNNKPARSTVTLQFFR